MGTILFDDKFTKDERVILTKAFKKTCTLHNINGRDFAVHLKKEHFDNKYQYGRVARLPDHFLVEMNSNHFNLFDATSCLMHETTHIKQHLVGEMGDSDDGVVWKGTVVPRLVTECSLFYDMLPWETEAWAFQTAEHKPFVLGLPPDERALVNPKHSNGLVKLWK